MSRETVVEVVLIREQVREEAILAGLSEEEYLDELKLKNENASGYQYDIEVVNDWRASPEGYGKKYRMRRTVKGRNNFVVGIPYDAIKRRAFELSISVDQFIKDYTVVATYGDSEYITYRFKKIFKG